MEEYQKYFFQTTFHHHFQAKNINFIYIFHFEYVNHVWISHILGVKKDGFSNIYFLCWIVRFKHKINIYLFLAVASQTEDLIFYQSIALKEKVAGDFNGLEKKLALQQVPFVEKNGKSKKYINLLLIHYKISTTLTSKGKLGLL